MISLNNTKLLEPVFNFIDDKSSKAIRNLRRDYYISSLSDYLLNGWVATQKPSPILKYLLKINNLVRSRLPDDIERDYRRHYSDTHDHSVGYTIPDSILKAIMDGIYARSSLLKHLDITKTDSDRVSVSYNQVQALRWPGEEISDYSEKDPEAEYLQVNLNVALLIFLISSKGHVPRSKSIEEDYIESNIEALVEYFDQAIIYGSNSQAKISGLYPKSTKGNPTPLYNYVMEVESFDVDYLSILKNSMAVKYRKDAAWLMNTDTGRLLSGLLLLDVHNELPDRILGIPVIYNDYMDSVDSHDSAPIILVNLKKAYTFLEGSKYKSPSVRRFEEPIRSEKEEIIALSRYRFGGKLTNQDAIRVLRIKNEGSLVSDSTRIENTNKVYGDISEIVEKLGSK